MSEASRRLPFRRRFLARSATALATAVLASLTVYAGGPLAAPASAAVAGEITQTVTYNGKTVTVRLQPFSLRAPGFEVLVQQADGSMVAQSVGTERGYLGSVDGDAGAVASAIRRSDGVLEGTITFDRGATWRFRDGVVYSTRGLTPPASYKWPSATSASRNVSTSSGQAGITTYRWDIGYDLANDWFTDPGTINGSVAKALDAVESEVAGMTGLYISNALLRPALGRVIIRANAAKDPYAVKDSLLNKITNEWADNQTDANVDVVVGRHTPSGGGGVAWIGTAATDWTGASVQGSGADVVVTRHEVGHNWSSHDNHTNGPEGPTVMSGNQYDRFDGTELSSIFRHRDWAIATQGSLTSVGTFGVPVPPYAALDLVDNVDSGVLRRFRPLANDHDANGGALTLLSVQPTSKLGGQVSKTNDTINYLPPTVGATDTVDSVEYVVQDASGKTATGVAIFRVDPYVAPPAASTWPSVSVYTGTQYVMTNRESGFAATARAENPTSTDLVQRKDAGLNESRFTFVNAGGNGTNPYFRVKNVATGKCMTITGGVGAFVSQTTCNDNQSLKWRLVEHPKGGVALLSVKSGLCLSPKDGSIASGVRLTQVKCGLSLTTAWDVAAPPVSSWPAASVDPAKTYTLRNPGSGLYAGLPVGSTEWEDLVLRAQGVGSRFTFAANPDGTWTIKETSSADCVDGYGSTGAGIWGCHGGDNQKWRALKHPGGGVALVNVDSGTCLAPSGGGSTAGTLLGRQTCTADPANRWTLTEYVAAP